MLFLCSPSSVGGELLVSCSFAGAQKGAWHRGGACDFCRVSGLKCTLAMGSASPQAEECPLNSGGVASAPQWPSQARFAQSEAIIRCLGWAAVSGGQALHRAGGSRSWRWGGRWEPFPSEGVVSSDAVMVQAKRRLWHPLMVAR